jgi:hypothetical protein
MMNTLSDLPEKGNKRRIRILAGGIGIPRLPSRKPGNGGEYFFFQGGAPCRRR